MREQRYTTQLQAGLGMINETRILMDLWEPGMSVPSLYTKALKSGNFPSVSARRLRNIVAECFAPRYMNENDYPIRLLKEMQHNLTASEYLQLLFIYTCRANLILADFVKLIYWNLYSSGRDSISIDEARKFVIHANQQGKTSRIWSDNTIRRVSSYLIGCCSDFGLAENVRSRTRKILPYRILPRTTGILAYDIHFTDLGDNGVITHPDWQLFGLQIEDVRQELKQPLLNGYFVIQTAGELTRIGWNYSNWEGVIHVLD